MILASGRGLIIAAPASGSGKTLVTLGLLAALKQTGVRVAPAKTGPDYIDTAFLGRAAGTEAINLDPWAMPAATLQSLAGAHAAAGELLLVEGVMGLFDGAADGSGSTADLATTLGLPVVLVVDAARQSQSIAALVSGFATWRPEVKLVGVILNRVASERHKQMLIRALSPLGIAIVGAIPRLEGLEVPSRHLGLVLPAELAGFDSFVQTATRAVSGGCDLELLQSLAAPFGVPDNAPKLPPLGQHIAIARDQAFAFLYPHWVRGWREQGADLSFFSPLDNQAPASIADAIFLPGGYPELHAETLAAAETFLAGMRDAQQRGVLIYGECGGYMVLGAGLTDKHGKRHNMTGLLPVETFMNKPGRVLGYRKLSHRSPLPFPARLAGHEFHYSTSGPHSLPPLFEAQDALGARQSPMGSVDGRVMGSYAHVIGVAGALS